MPDGPGCLVFDVRMPGTSGLDLYEALVARGEGMPVIFITAFADVPMAVRAMKSGAVEFVEKPFNRQDLLDRVQRAIKDDVDRRRAARPIARRSARRFQELTDEGARGPGAHQRRTTQQGDLRHASTSRPRRRDAKGEPDEKAQRPHLGRVAQADARTRGAPETRKETS